jgi:hypothetical protein
MVYGDGGKRRARWTRHPCRFVWRQGGRVTGGTVRTRSRAKGGGGISCRITMVYEDGEKTAVVAGR